MKALTLSPEQTAIVIEDVHTAVPTATPIPLDDAALLSMPISEAKRLAASSFERRYLVSLMARAGSVSEGARLAGLDRTNFRRLLHRHGLR